jgi:hypothetical protein
VRLSSACRADSCFASDRVPAEAATRHTQHMRVHQLGGAALHVCCAWTLLQPGPDGAHLLQTPCLTAPCSSQLYPLHAVKERDIKERILQQHCTTYLEGRG